MRQIDRLNAEMLPLRDQIITIGAHQPGCRALRDNHYGVGPFLSVAIWEELGDCRRFTSSDDAVRHAGLDVTVYSSDGKRTRGHLAKQGPPVLRWALYEAAVSRPVLPRPTMPTSGSSRTVSTVSSRCSRSPASSLAAATTHCATSRRWHWHRTRPERSDHGASRPPTG